MLLKTGWQYLFKFTYANRFPLMLALPLKLPADAFRLKPPTGPRGRSFDLVFTEFPNLQLFNFDTLWKMENNYFNNKLSFSIKIGLGFGGGF